MLFIFAVNLRLQLLSPSFWQTNFNSTNTYSRLSLAISRNLESQTVAEGGKASDVKPLTDLASSENIKDFVGKNINNVLSYANGKSRELLVYVPISKIPKSLLSKNFSGLKEQMQLSELVKEFNVEGISLTQIQSVSRFGFIAWITFIITLLFLALLFYCMYLLIDPGKQLVVQGLAFILSGTAIYLFSCIGNAAQMGLANDLSNSSSLGNSIVRIIVPSVIQGFLSVWTLSAVLAIIFGIILLFFKKPIK
jgi:hypothetical protein